MSLEKGVLRSRHSPRESPTLQTPLYFPLPQGTSGHSPPRLYDRPYHRFDERSDRPVAVVAHCAAVVMRLSVWLTASRGKEGRRPSRHGHQQTEHTGMSSSKGQCLEGGGRRGWRSASSTSWSPECTTRQCRPLIRFHKKLGGGGLDPVVHQISPRCPVVVVDVTKHAEASRT